MTEISVSFGDVIGRVKPMHGVNNSARMTNYGELLPEFTELKVPFCRLHDTGGRFGGAHYVDVNNVFPDFGADENDPASYDFTLTDCYILPLVRAGAEVFYRLGTTIEHEPKKYNIFPPADPAKWARVCEHIVRHYNRGWANGHELGIKYWEIWNEPDAMNPECEPNGCPNWQGTAEEFYELYCTAAKHIKALHPEVLVGGYSSCYILGSFVNGGWFPGDYSFFTGFLQAVAESGAPLDFFSWHGYLGRHYIDKVETESEFVDRILGEYGFSSALRFDNEWNVNIASCEGSRRRVEYQINYRSEKGASHCAAAMYKMQRCKIDAAMYYDAQLWVPYGGLFEVPSLKKTKTWHVFRQFGELYELGEWCRSTDSGLVYTCAAKGRGQKRLNLANIDEQPVTVRLVTDLPEGTAAAVFAVDAQHDGERIYSGALPETLTLPASSSVSILFE